MTGCKIMNCKYWDGKLCTSPNEICLYQTEDDPGYAELVGENAALKTELENYDPEEKARAEKAAYEQGKQEGYHEGYRIGKAEAPHV